MLKTGTSQTEFVPYEIKSPDGESQGWYAAFRDRWYGDYVIEFGKKFSSREEVCDAVATGNVYPHMPCPFGEK